MRSTVSCRDTESVIRSRRRREVDAKVVVEVNDEIVERQKSSKHPSRVLDLRQESKATLVEMQRVSNAK